LVPTVVGFTICACANPAGVSKMIAASIALMTNPKARLNLCKLKHISLVGNTAARVQVNWRG
jgi:hypothetical protein